MGTPHQYWDTPKLEWGTPGQDLGSPLVRTGVNLSGLVYPSDHTAYNEMVHYGRGDRKS